MDIIVVGCGRVGSQLATLLSEEGNNVVIIDKEPKAFNRLGSTFDGVTKVGLGFDEQILTEAGIETCDYFVSVTNLDNTNLMAAEVARKIFGVENVAARLYNPERGDTYRRLDLEFVCGTTLVAEELIKKIHLGKRHRVEALGEVDEMQFTVAEGLAGRPVGTVNEDGKILIAAIRRGDRTFIPSNSTLFEEGDYVVMFVRGDAAARIKKMIKE